MNTMMQRGSGSANAIAAEREEIIWKLRLAGKTLVEIGRELDLSHSYVKKILDKRIDRTLFPLVHEYRIVQNDRLEEAIEAIWPDVLEGKYQAIHSFIKLEERRARLLGLDAAPNLRLEISDGPKPWDAIYAAVLVDAPSPQYIEGSTVEGSQ